MFPSILNVLTAFLIYILDFCPFFFFFFASVEAIVCVFNRLFYLVWYITLMVFQKWKWSHSVVSDSLWPRGLQPTGSSVHEIFQARILEWVVISFSRGSSWPRSRTQVSHIVGRRFNLWTTRKPWHIGVSYYSGGIVLLCFGVPRAILTLKDYLEWFVRAWNSFVQRFITQL